MVAQPLTTENFVCVRASGRSVGIGCRKARKSSFTAFWFILDNFLPFSFGGLPIIWFVSPISLIFSVEPGAHISCWLPDMLILGCPALLPHCWLCLPLSSPLYCVCFLSLPAQSLNKPAMVNHQDSLFLWKVPSEVYSEGPSIALLEWHLPPLIFQWSLMFLSVSPA